MGRIVQHKNNKSIWLYNYPQFETMDDCREYILCLSERDMNLIWNAIQNIWTIQSRVYNSAEGTTYEVVEDEEWEIFIDWVATLRNHLGDWPMCNDILQQIADNILALVDKPCCPGGTTTGSRGTGSSQAEPNPYDQAATPEEPPTGFESMEEYESRKCNAANDIINSLGSDLLSLSALTYAAQPPTGITAILITILLTPIPYDDLIALAAYLIYSAIAYSFLAEMAAQIDDDRENLLCVLYSSVSVEDARTNFEDALQSLAEAQGWTTPQVDFVMGAIDYFLTNDSLNLLFENLPTVTQDADCSECGDDCTPITTGVTFDFGSVTNHGDGRYTIVAVAASGWPCGANAREVAFYRMTSGFRITEFSITSGTPATCGTDIYHVFTGMTTPYVGGEATSNTGIGVPQNLGSVYVISSAAFTMQVRLCEIP